MMMKLYKNDSLFSSSSTSSSLLMTIMMMAIIVIDTSMGASINGQTIENEHFKVVTKPNFNTPEYFFNRKDGTDQSVYKLKFNRFFESVPGQSGGTYGGSNIGLPSLNWSLENINNTAMTFDIVATDTSCTSSSSSCCFNELRFQNKLQTESMKFDVIITGYQMCQVGNDINLVYKLTKDNGSNDDSGTTTDSGNSTASFDNADFSIVQTATQSSGNPVTVSLSYIGNSNSGGIKTTYSGFEGNTLTHDPTMTVNNRQDMVEPIACFSADATVIVHGKGKVPMKDIIVGDEVLTSSGQYQEVYAIDHRHTTKLTNFIQIDTNIETERPLEITPTHMLFIQGESNPVPASFVKVGDAVQTTQGYQQVTGVSSIRKNGLYNPLTTDGTMIVDGVVASTYTAFSANNQYVTIAGWWQTPISHQAFVHMSLAPLRAICGTVFSSSFCHLDIDQEKIGYSEFGNQFWNFMQSQSIIFQMFTFGASTTIFGLCSIIPLFVALITLVVGSFRKHTK